MAHCGKQSIKGGMVRGSMTGCYYYRFAPLFLDNRSEQARAYLANLSALPDDTDDLIVLFLFQSIVRCLNHFGQAAIPPLLTYTPI